MPPMARSPSLQLMSKVFEALAGERRRVAADWRVHCLARRAALARGIPAPEVADVRRWLVAARKCGDLRACAGLDGVYVVDTPYARVLPVSDEAIVMEADPWSTLSHFTALVHHALTDELPRGLWATHFTGAASRPRLRLPLGTTPEDWIDAPRPRVRHPAKIDDIRVTWTSCLPALEFGVEVRLSEGVPVYVTDIERTLLDALRTPGLAGGARTVFRAWRRGRGRLDLDRLTEYVERFASPVMRQRAGFVLSQLGLEHPRMTEWRGRLQRGSSLVLVAGEPFAAAHSADWNLSLNTPDGVVAELSDDEE